MNEAQFPEIMGFTRPEETQPAAPAATGESIDKDRKTMTKADLVEEVARVAELAKKDAQVIVETVFDHIVAALQKGEGIELRGFGSFRFRSRGPRRGRNPKTGTPVSIPSKRTPYFKPGKALKEIINE
jgi:integration host factor subunit beta